MKLLVSRALALACLLLAAATVASAAGMDSIPGAQEIASAGAAGASGFAGAGSAMKSTATSAVGSDPEPAPVGGMPADPAPDARG